MKRFLLFSGVVVACSGLIGCGSYKATDKMLTHPVVHQQTAVQTRLAQAPTLRVQKHTKPALIYRPVTLQQQAALQQPVITHNASPQVIQTPTQAVHIQYLDKASIKRIQRALRDQGFNPGPIDGIYGKRTDQAMTRFQWSLGESHEVTAKTLKKLGVIG